MGGGTDSTDSDKTSKLDRCEDGNKSVVRIMDMDKIWDRIWNKRSWNAVADRGKSGEKIRDNGGNRIVDAWDFCLKLFYNT